MDEGLPQKRGRARFGGKRIWLAAGVIAAVLAFAWFDGGEEPIRPISQEISVPEGR